MYVASIAVAGLVFLGGPSTPASAHDDRCCESLRAVPFAFVGEEGECGEIAPGVPYPAGSRIVTAGWLGGMGLPDNGGDNFGLLPIDNPNKRDPHLGLLLNKNGTTPDCSSSGARILGVRGMVLGTLSEIGFDYRNGGHCGAGAPRFNVVVKNLLGMESSHFVGGCANDAAFSPAPQDPLQWTRVRFTTASPLEAFPLIPPGSKVVSITLLYDEGTDVPTPQDPQGVGLAVVDNIYINGELIRRGTGIAPHPRDDGDDDCDKDGWKNDEDQDDDNDGLPDWEDEDDDNDGISDSDSAVILLGRAAILGNLGR
jgi:hypothetical protein